jgi:hypothetical protein
MPLAFVGALVLVVPEKKHDEPISNVMLFEGSPRSRVVLVTAESFCEPQRETTWPPTGQAPKQY